MADRRSHSQLAGDIRMTLLDDNYIADLRPHRFKAGTVVLVNEETAERWEHLGIARPSEETDKTAAEQLRARKEALEKQIAELESHTAKTSAVSDDADAAPKTGRKK